MEGITSLPTGKDALAFEQEEFVLYRLYPKIDRDDPEELANLMKKYLQIIEKFTEDYIWHKETFMLQPQPRTKALPPHIYGKLRFGENIEDEWFVVFLLLQLTIHFEDLVVSVEDLDGQFLLIEAATEIPRWLKPETSTNRVFLFRGKVHIVPLPSTPAEFLSIPALMTVPVAVDLVRRGDVITEASVGVQDAIGKRVWCFPQKAVESMHVVRCYLPVTVAQVLHNYPQLISAAVEAFYYRDVDAMKDCVRMERFSQGEGSGPVKSVMRMVTLTRHLYGQLAKQEFYPPKVFGTTPPPTHPDHKAFMIGVKIACGFEILYQQGKREGTLENIEKDPEWIGYNQKLARLGFYKNELKGSKLYRQLEHQAKLEFLLSKQSHKLSTNENTLLPPAELIDKILAQPMPPLEELSGNLRKDDDDQWMNVTPEEFEQLLAAKQGPPFKQTEKIDQLLSQMKSFMGSTSDYEGVEAPRDVDFDVDKFMSVMSDALGVEGSTAEGEDFSDGDEIDSEGEMEGVMEQMDAELAEQPALAKDFELEEETREVNLDFNLVKNLLESFSSQQGMSGPVSNILGDWKLK